MPLPKQPSKPPKKRASALHNPPGKGLLPPGGGQFKRIDAQIRVLGGTSQDGIVVPARILISPLFLIDFTPISLRLQCAERLEVGQDILLITPNSAEVKGRVVVRANDWSQMCLTLRGRIG